MQNPGTVSYTRAASIPAAETLPVPDAMSCGRPLVCGT